MVLPLIAFFNKFLDSSSPGKNPNEKINGKDDDGNGYIDDINGWNFLGDVVAENMEFVRILASS